VAGGRAAAGGMGSADGDCDRNAAGAVDRAGDAATAGRQHAAAVDQERHAVAGRAVATGGGKNGRPRAVIGADAPCIGGARQGERGKRGGGKEGFGAEARENGEISGNHGECAHFSYLPGTCHLLMTPFRHRIGPRGSSLPKLLCSAISPTFIARLNKGCRGDVFVQGSPFWKNLSTFNALTSISAGLTPLAGGFVLASLGEPNAQV